MIQPAEASPAESRRQRVYDSILVIAPYLIVFGLIGFLRHAVGFLDAWVRMASGRLVLEEWAIPRHDQFSFTSPGADWLDHEWLPGVAMYLLYQVHYEVLILAILLIVLAPFALLHRDAVRRGAPAVLMAGVISVAMISAWRNYAARPTVINPLFFTVLLLLIESKRGNIGDNAGPRRALLDRRVLAMVGLMIVWSNLHAGFLVGLALLSVWLVSSLVERRDRAVAAGILLVASAGALLNPYGFELIEYTVRAVAGNSPDRDYIEEWLSPDFQVPLNWTVFPAIILAMYLGLRDLDLFRRLLIAGTLVGSLIAARYEPFFAIAIVFAATPILAGKSAPKLPRGIPYGAGILSVLALVLYVGTIGYSSVRSEPTEGLAYLRANCPEERVLASIEYSSWLVYEKYPVFIDARTNQVYADGLIRDYFTLDTLEYGWDKVPEKYGIRVVMWERDSKVANALRDIGWTPVFSGDVEVILARADGSEALPCQSGT